MIPTSFITKNPSGPEEIERAELYGRRVTLMLAAGNWEGAKEIIDAAQRALEYDGSDVPLLATALCESEINERTLNVLEDKTESIYVGDLLHVGTAQLLATPYVSENTIDHIWHSVLKYAASRVEQAKTVGDCGKF